MIIKFFVESSYLNGLVEGPGTRDVLREDDNYRVALRFGLLQGTLALSIQG